MKPKNRVYCHEAQRPKMLFDTEKEANTFIKFNWQELTDDPEKLRAYYCSTCGGYHITSHAYNPNYGWRTRLALSQYDEVKHYKSIAHINDISYLKKLLQSHNNILYFQKPKFKVKIRKIEYDPQTDEIIVTYGDYYDSKKDKIENILNVQNGQVKMLLDSLKRELSKNENIIMKQDNKKLYESIMASVAKQVKKALNENLTVDEIEAMHVIEPHCWESDREENWYNAGLKDGVEAVKARILEKGLNWEEIITL